MLVGPFGRKRWRKSGRRMRIAVGGEETQGLLEGAWLLREVFGRKRPKVTRIPMRWNGEITLLPFDQEVEVSIRRNSCQNGIFESDS